MRSFLSISFVLLLVSFLSCTQSSLTNTSPLEPDLFTKESDQGYEDICRSNMRVIAGQQTIFFAGNNRYANTLEELGLAGLSCAECELEYLLVVNDTSYSIFCPSPLNPNHGNIIDGVPSWIDPPSSACHDNMLSLISAQNNFYTEHNRYANSIEELGQSYRKCPECNLSYIVTGNETDYTISCPLPSFPTHGDVKNGIPSWSVSEHNNCRANMITVASQEAIYFAGHDKYTNSLEELGLARLCCSECGLTYVLTATDSTYAVYCPSPLNPNHGNIVNGVPSWHY